MRARKQFRVDQAESHDVAVTKKLYRPVLRNVPPDSSVVSFPPNPQGVLTFDFAPHYDLGFDPIVSALQQTVEICLAENVVEASTVTSYCSGGVKSLCDYLTLYRKGLNRELLLVDITVEFIENYIQHLKISHPNGTTAKVRYTQGKSLLRQMLRMGWIAHLDFPKNPFPHSNKQAKGQKPFSKSERKCIAQALKKDVAIILSKNEPLTANELVICMLAIALRSGMNTVPLLEMTTDSIKDHPLKENRKLLVLYKRRGNATHIQSLRHAKEVENAQTVLADVAMIVEHVIRVNALVRAELGSDLVFAYRARGGGNVGQPRALSSSMLTEGINSWRKEHDLKNDN